MAFPTVEATAASTTTPASTSHTITLPAGVVAGDLLIAWIVIENGSAPEFTWPAGWTELFDITDGDDTSVYSAAWKEAVASEPNPVVTSGSSDISAQCAYRISGAEDPATQAPEFATFTFAEDFPDPPNLTPTGGAKDYLWIAATGYNSGDPTTAAPTSYAPLLNAQNAAMEHSTAHRTLNAASENPGIFTVTDDGSCIGSAVTIVVHPASGGAPQTLTPAPVVAAWGVPAQTIQAGGVTVAPAAAVANFVVPAPTILNAKTLTPAPVVATFAVPAPIIVAGGATLAPASVVSNWVVPAPTLVATKTLTPAAVIASFVVPAPTVQVGQLTLTPAPVVSTFVVPDPTVVAGALTLQPAPVIASFSVPAPTLLKVKTLTPGAVVASFVVPAPTVQVGQLTLTPAPVVSTFVVPDPTVVAGALTLQPAPVIASFSVTRSPRM